MGAPYIDLSYDTNAEFLLAAAVLTTSNAIASLVVFVTGGFVMFAKNDEALKHQIILHIRRID